MGRSSMLVSGLIGLGMVAGACAPPPAPPAPLVVPPDEAVTINVDCTTSPIRVTVNRPQVILSQEDQNGVEWTVTTVPNIVNEVTAEVRPKDRSFPIIGRLRWPFRPKRHTARMGAPVTSGPPRRQHARKLSKLYRYKVTATCQLTADSPVRRGGLDPDIIITE